MATPCPKQRENKMPRKTTSKQAPDDGKPRRQHRLSGKKRRQLAGDNPFAAPHYGPTDSFQFMEEEMVNIYRALFGLVTCAALLPFVLVYMAIDEIARRKRRRAYYEREKEKRIELADKKRMKLGEYAKPGDIAEGRDGRYYVYDREEFARRVALESERRRIRRHETTNKCPTSAELKAQWAKVRESHVEMLRFGSMLCDLEAYVDNGIMFDGNGDFAGRKPGVKGWLTEHCPEIRARYVTAMRYKAMAVRARQAIGMDEPNPLDAVLGGVTGKADDGPNGAGGGRSPAVGGRPLIDDEILCLNTGCEVTAYAEQNQRDAGKTADGRVTEWRRMLKEILDDAERRDGRVRRRGGRPRRKTENGVAGNGGTEGANGGKTEGGADVTCRAGTLRKEVANDSNTAIYAAEDGGNSAEGTGSVGKRRVTQTALVLALEAVSEPLWALVKSVGTGNGAQSA